MAAGKRSSNPPAPELPVSGVEPEVDEPEEAAVQEDPSISVEEICILAYRDMLQAMAYPFGILTVKQVKLAKTFAKLMRISDARQKMEMRAVYASLEAKRQFLVASEEAAAMDVILPPVIPAYVLAGPNPAAQASVSGMASSSSSLPDRAAASLQHQQHHRSADSKAKKREKKNKSKMRRLLSRIKAAAASKSPPSNAGAVAVPGLDQPSTSSASSYPSSSASAPFPADSSSSSRSGALLFDLADVAMPVAPPLLRPTPVTPLLPAVESVVERYRGEVKALWKSRNRHCVRNAEIST